MAKVTITFALQGLKRLKV